MPYINMLVSTPSGRLSMVALAFVALSLLWAGNVLASEGVDQGEAQVVVVAQEQNSDPEANLPFLFAVYIITWGGFFAYSFAMSRRQREIQRELDALKAVIADKESQPGAG
jgi:CcmD family protein